MGVPSFYRWLVNKYPKVVSEGNAKEECGSSDNPDCFDNLYLDLNGIIHPCFHPDDELFPPTTFDEVFNRMHEYIDLLFAIVKPRRLLFLAIDGVAPRAKMNQQRARRFRSSKENQMAQEMEDKLRHEFEKEGKALLPKEEYSQVSDSNVITPGTEFMLLLSKNLQTYIRCRVSQDQTWGSIKVILSDDRVPGEGEHKIMSFIRSQRSLPDYDPNTRHCLYGLDADLIMLALATHEIHFSILREEVLPPVNQRNPASGSEKPVSCEESSWAVNKKKHYQFLNIWVLREYLALDMDIVTNDFDLERVVDDFIFICFLAGNDFLPHLPSIEIHEGCIDLLMHVYRKEFESFGGYLVDTQRVHDKKGRYIKLKRVERFMLLIGTYEEKIFQKRSELRDRKLRRIIAEHQDAQEDERNAIDDGRASDVVCSSSALMRYPCTAVNNDEDAYKNTEELKQKLKDLLKKSSDLYKDGFFGTATVKFGTDGFKERYYRVKFNAQSPSEAEAIRKSVVAKYGEGLCWSLLYYFSGVPSWTWFYPYHYGPLASDCRGLAQTNVKFQKGLPFKPFDQLMGVLPSASAHALPCAYRRLMSDPSSTILDFYPTEFEVDVDGKRFTWQGICKLPFIEEGRLLSETRKLDNELKDNEMVRNSESLDQLFLRFYGEFDYFCRGKGASEKISRAIKMSLTLKGIEGVVHMTADETIFDSADASAGVVKRLFFEVHQDFQHVPRLLEGATVPEKTVREEDVVETTLWHERSGRSSNYINRFQHQRLNQNHRMESASLASGKANKFRGAGCGFSMGRGKSHIGEFGPVTAAASGHQEQWSSGRSNCRREPFVPRFDPSWGSKEYCGSMEQLKISQPNRRYSTNDKPSRMDTSFRPTNRSLSNEDWRLPKLRRDSLDVNLQKQTVEGSMQKQPPNQSFSANSGRGRERGWFADKNSYVCRNS